MRAADGHPLLVSTSRHVSQGILEVTGEKWDERSRVLSGTSKVIGADPYELRIAGLSEGSKTWHLLSATVSSSDQDAGVTTAAEPIREEGWLRVAIDSKESRPVSWSLRFSDEPGR